MKDKKLYIQRAIHETDFERSAYLLSHNEPWVTLGRTYEYSLAKVKDAAGELYVAREDDRVIGCLLLQMHGELKGFIRSFCVDPSCQSLGLGAKMLRMIEERIFVEAPNVFVFAASFNEGAKRFYEKNGYQPIGVFKDYVARSADEILFRKTIGPSNEFCTKYPYYTLPKELL